MVIQKDKQLHGLSGDFHLRVNAEGNLRFQSGASGKTVMSDDGQADYNRIVEALTKGETFVDLDTPVKKTGGRPKGSVNKSKTTQKATEQPADAK